MTSEVSLSIPLNCSCVAELSRSVECSFCGFKERAKRDVSSLSSDSGIMDAVLDVVMSIQHVHMSFFRPGSPLQDLAASEVNP